MECFVTFISHVFHETKHFEMLVKHIEMLVDPADLGQKVEHSKNSVK